jgi:anti-sigma factor RsiW
MSEMQGPGETELHAYLDGELDAPGRAEVEAWLETHPEDAERLEGWRGDREAMAALHQDLLNEAVPERMQAALRQVPQTPEQATGKSNSGNWMRAAASVVLLVAGAVAGWIAHDVAAPPPTETSAQNGFVRNAVSAHVVFTRERSHAVEVKAGKAKDEKHLVRWLSKRLGRPLNPPLLTTAGFALVGGRLVADDGGPAAQFMYQDDKKNRLTLYVRNARNAENTAFRIVSDRDVSAFYWIDKTYAYALIGKIDRDRLVPLGELVYTHLQKK